MISAFTLGDCLHCKRPVYGGSYTKSEDGSVAHYTCWLEAELARLREREAEAVRLIERALAGMTEHDRNCEGGAELFEAQCDDLRAWLGQGETK